ncbi:MAG: hypothetical protein JXB88_01440 [Spirochaetales bacterium]|nr:hypothetical protein [Spirochaetales bacterium]
MFILISILPVIFILVIASEKAKHREVTISRLSGLYEDELCGGVWYSVRYASKARFVKIWKIFPWEDCGILGIKKDAITFYSNNNQKIVFPAGQLFVEWIGTKYWPNGVIAWFLIRYGYKDHYFTSDTGKWASGSDTTTKEIFEKIKEILSQMFLNDPGKGIP